MKKILLLSLVLNSGVWAQELTWQVMDDINAKLSRMAQAKGYELDWRATDFEYALSNWAIVVPATLFVAAVGAVASRPFFRGSMQAWVQGSGGAAASTATASFVAYRCPDDEAECSAFRLLPWLKVGRNRVDYILNTVSSYPREEIHGSCMVSVVSYDRKDVDDLGFTDYEIDACTDSYIFPQTEEGKLRVGGIVSEVAETLRIPWDEWLGRTKIVASDRVYH